MAETDAVNSMLAAHKQALQLLDQRIATVSKLIEEDEREERVPDYPYFYGVVGEDGENGIPLFPGPNREFIGKIQLQSDAPFVWTHVQACMRFLNNPQPPPFGQTNPLNFLGIWNAADGRDERQAPSISLGFVEEGSGRVLFQSNRRGPAGDGNAVDTQLISGSVFDTGNLHDMDAVGSTSEWSAGNGPLTVMNLPCDVLLPENDVITVKAQPTYVDRDFAANIINPDARLYVTLVGYKIFGE